MRFVVPFPLISFLFFASKTVSAQDTRNVSLPSVSTIWSWPKGSWAESIAVRRNGKLLVTRVDIPELWQIDPAGHSASLVHSFDDHLALSGITEVTPDVFAVVAVNFSLATGILSAGSSSIWTVDFSNHTTLNQTTVSKVTGLPEAGLPNGLTVLNATEGTILAADSYGAVINVNIHTGEYAVVLEDATLQPAANLSTLGVNGIHVRGKYLYYTNSNQHLFGRVKINANGTAAAPFEVLYQDSSPPFDDFALDKHGVAYITHTTGYGLTRVGTNGNGTLILGNVNATLGTTAAAFSNNGSVLYVTTNGGLVGPARVLAVTGL